MHSLRHAEAMDRFVNEYIPALLVIGTAVRTCHWGGRDMNTGDDARDCMRMAACTLMSLYGPRARFTEHTRDVCLALMVWQDWHSSLPGAIFSEEKCEALLGRFATSLGRHPSAVTPDALDDIFMQTNPGRRGLASCGTRTRRRTSAGGSKAGSKRSQPPKVRWFGTCLGPRREGEDVHC
jgi:hypothetical protein